MEINSKVVNGIKVVELAGSIDALSAGDVERFFDQEIDHKQENIIMDLGRVDFMSSAGLRVIMAISKSLRLSGGDLRLAAAQPGVEKMLKISGFTSILKTYPNITAAANSLAI